MVSQNDTGTAPYNFVPLNKRIVRAVKRADHLPDHDTFIDDKGKYAYHGYIDVELETLSPTYIRAPQTAENLADENFVASDFFHRGDPKKPVIPGSSLRGMLRTLVEIVTYGKLRSVTDQQLIYRAVFGNSSIAQEYTSRFTGPNVGGGISRGKPTM